MAKAALVIMAAGMGSRYGGTKQVEGVGPNGEILMQYSVFDAVRAGFDKVVFVIKPEMQEVMERLCGNMARKMTTAEGKPVEVAYAFQTLAEVPAFYTVPKERTRPFGTCHAVLCSHTVVHEPFCVINADDYYGVDAYRTIFNALIQLKSGEAVMVGYLLKNTVTEHGTVSRGVCTTKNGKLAGVEEMLKIQCFPDGTIADVNQNIKTELAEDTVVSMNFWGFMPDIYKEMDRYFNDFLRAEGDNIKSECMLPRMVEELIRSGKLSVSVLSSGDRWFGMTYQEDRKVVAQALRKLHETGVYPVKLEQ